ncbi:type VI secretion system contractile sheath small subunit [Alcaligenes sp. CHO6]|jgi:type VI secretion system protein ImpB|uniref:type VI secretion system contractile sheath small subunit n=1 Tax=unclassified Alcaligenes TaxID=259357 RepID=UPI000B266846|nr:type VI secretion system contractile sheath small subunit [Alcaligenes faecalis]HRL21952.1 type VI secretion system contractile sheath small subunit [Alcaligenes sp.]
MSVKSNSGSGQKFLGRNRAPRVQIEYDVELYGAEHRVQLPFVMGVLADLAGHNTESLPDLGERKFMEIDVDNFDDRMKSIAPKLNMQVPNSLTGDGVLGVEVSFDSMDSFSPAELARQIEPLARLLEARTQLANLLTYMDGKSGAEALLSRLLEQPELLRALAGRPPQALTMNESQGDQDSDPHA